MTTLLQKLTQFFAHSCSYASDMERYVASKNPTNTAEVEFWLNQYNRKALAREL